MLKSKGSILRHGERDLDRIHSKQIFKIFQNTHPIHTTCVCSLKIDLDNLEGGSQEHLSARNSNKKTVCRNTNVFKIVMEDLILDLAKLVETPKEH